MIITFNGVDYDYNPEFSFKDFTGSSVTIPSGTIVYGSCFSQESPDTNVFGDSVNLTFVKCNLDNCKLPDGTQAPWSTTRRIMTIDGVDWIVDDQNNPLEQV